MAAMQNAMTVDLSGGVAVVTGGAQGIGHAIALAVRQCGAIVHVLDRTNPPATDRSDEIQYHEIDVSNSAQVNAVVAGLSPVPSLLVNNAGIARDRTIAKMTDDEWDSVLSVNLTGAFNCLRAVARPMADAGRGRIVNITSINGLRGKFGQANYAASKAGLVGLTKTAAREFGRKGVTVNAVAPGMVMTEMAKTLPPDIIDAALRESVTGRLPTVEDIVCGTLFLLSDAAGAITGQVLQIDSGQYI